MKTRCFSIFIFLVLFIAGGGVLMPQIADAAAAGLVPCGGAGQPACQPCHLLVMFGAVVDALLLRWMPIIVTVLVAVGGFIILGSQGNPGQLNKGKDIITWALLGYGVMLISWILVGAFFGMVGLAEWTGLGNWWNFSGACRTTITGAPPTAHNSPVVQALINANPTPINPDKPQGDQLIFQDTQTGINGRPRYAINYLAEFNIFQITLNSGPVSDVRREAEENFIQKAGKIGGRNIACEVPVAIVTAWGAEPNQGGNSYDERLNACSTNLP